MGKRTNNQVASKVAAKKAKSDPTLASIADVIMEAEDLPERCRAMLVDVLPFSLTVSTEERHEIHSAAADMVEQTLNAKRSLLEAVVATEETKLANLTSQQVDVASTASEAEMALAAQKELVQTAKLALAEATTAANASRTTLTELRSEQTTGDAKLAHAQEMKTGLESAFELHFKPMKEDAAGPHFKELEPFLKSIEMEESLLIALPSTCAKSKEHRGTFDTVVLDELEKSIALKIAALGDTITAETPASVARGAAAEDAQKEYDAKKASQMRAVADFEALQKEHSDRGATLSKAKVAVDELQPQVDLVTGSVDKAKVALEGFVAGPLAGFKTFSVRTVETAPAEAAPAGA